MAAVYDAAAKRRSVYYDGVRVGVSEGVSVGRVTSALFDLGRKQSSETDWFKGRLDDVAVWDCALTPEQVRRLCREELPRAGKPLVPPGTVIRFAVEGDALVAHVLRAGTLLLVR